MSASVTFEDTGLSKLQENLLALKKLKVRIGYQDAGGKEIHPDSKIKVAHVAAIMEFGWPAKNIPARSFMRSTIERKADNIERVQRAQVQRVILGEATPVEALSEIGRYVTRLIRERLESASSWAEPLDAETVEDKGHGTPLDWTGTLKRNLGWRVSKGREVYARGK